MLTSSSSKVSMYNSICYAAERIDKEIIVIPADSDENILFNYMSSEFTVLPESNDSNLNDIIDILSENNIGIIFPSRDGELQFWAKNKDKLKELDIDVIVSPIKSVKVCLDKLEFYQYGYKNHFPVIKTFKDVKCLTLKNRYVVKERFGSGSKNIFLNVSKSEAIDIARDLHDFVFQPFIEGIEFSVDAWLDKHNSVKGIILRKRELIKNGESQITTTFQDEKIEKKLSQIFHHLKLTGPIVMQAIIDNDTRLHIIECNPRFGGASSLSIEAGLDSIYWSLYESFGHNIDELQFDRLNKEVRQIRIPKDIYRYGYSF